MPFNQPLAGLIEPDTDLWTAATPERRRAFYREAGRRARVRLQKQLLKGIGRTGRLMPTRKRPRADGADGPVMDPHEVDSRTVTLLDFRADAAGVTLYWHNGPPRPDQNRPWSTILGYHARGQVPGAPVRDVRLSNLNIHHLRREMGEWFEGRRTAARAGIGRLRTAPPIVPDQVVVQGVPFRRDAKAKARNDRVVMADVSKLEDQFRRDPIDYVGPGGHGTSARSSSYEDALRRLREAQAGGKPVDMPRVFVDASGNVSFGDGRHRFAAARDVGFTQIPVTAPRREAGKIASAIGAAAPKPAGRIDLENFTPGIGGSRQLVERSIAEGTFSGFRQRARKRFPK